VYVAVYVSFFVADTTSLSHPLNVYVYTLSAAFVGVSFVNVGVTPYSTVFLSNSVPS